MKCHNHDAQPSLRTRSRRGEKQMLTFGRPYIGLVSYTKYTLLLK